MAIKDAFLEELEQEAPLTRRYLERVPEDRLSWKPHEKSMTLGRLANHIAELANWGEVILTQSEFDIASSGDGSYEVAQAGSVKDILAIYDANLESLRERLDATTDEAFMQTWTLKNGGQEVFSAPRVGVTRRSVFNHIVHHRAQLSVYLRLNDVPLPASYGPSADEQV